jgi:mevalonate kinase
MKTIRYLLLAGLAVASLGATGRAWAQTAVTPPATVTPPIAVAPHDSTGSVPAAIRTLITSFDKTRDQYLKEQEVLLIKLKNATTASEREQIRQELQTNRETFLAALKTFRQQLKDELAALKGKISHEEFLRIIDAAHNAETEGGAGHHRGH